VVGWKFLRQGQKEVEEAHRPVLVPLADSRRMVVVETGLPEPPAARPIFLGEGQTFDPGALEPIGGPSARFGALRRPDLV